MNRSCRRKSRSCQNSIRLGFSTKPLQYGGRGTSSGNFFSYSVVNAISSSLLESGRLCCDAQAPTWLMRLSVRRGAPTAALILAAGAGVLYIAQSAFWAVTADIAGENVSVVSGIMNMGGQIGGACTASLTPLIAAHFGWNMSFATAAVIALIGALAWIAVDPTRQLMGLTRFAVSPVETRDQFIQKESPEVADAGAKLVIGKVAGIVATSK